MNARKPGSRSTAFLLAFTLIFPLVLAVQDNRYGSGRVDVNAAAPAAECELTRIVINPDVVELKVGQRQVFNVLGRDASGDPCPIANPVWTQEFGNCGILTPNGTTCALDATTSGTCTVVCTEGGTSISAGADITVNPTQLATIEVSPSTVHMNVGEHQPFTASGKDGYGYSYPISNPVWETSGGGTLTPNGTTCTYTAAQAGDHTITCREGATDITGVASIHTTAASPLLKTIEVSPSTVYMHVGEDKIFTASGKDQYGDPYPVSNPVWAATGGAITQLGQYTAGSLPGRYAVSAVVGQVEGWARVRVSGPAYCPDLGTGQSWQHTFPIAGVYPYYDRHEPNRRAVVVVGATASSALSRLGATDVVSITASGFVPLTVTVGLSDTVHWINTDAITHAVNGGLYYSNEVYLPVVMRSAPASVTAEEQP